jgi:hypothetical protein
MLRLLETIAGLLACIMILGPLAAGARIFG